MGNIIQYIDLGLIDYRKSYKIQEKIHQACWKNEFKDTIIIQENYPIFTLGRNSSDDNLLLSKDSLAKKGIEVEYVDRGGDITYHGPGQIVISPVLHLKKYMNSIHKYVRSLEEIVIRLLKKYNVNGGRIEGKSGVWIDEDKIAAVGIAIRHGITMHGVSINVKLDLSHFEYIIPCGIKDKGVTSLNKLGVFDINIEKIKENFIEEFNEVFNTKTKKIILDKKTIASIYD